MEPSTHIHVETPPRSDPTHQRQIWGRVLVLALAAVTIVLLVTSTAPRGSSMEWDRHQGPPGSVNLDSLVAVGDGFAVLSGMTASGVLLWWSPDGSQWERQALEGTPSQLAALGEDLIAYDGLEGRILRLSGDDWREEDSFDFPDDVRSRQGSGRPSIIGEPGSFLTVGLAGQVWLAEEGRGFEQVVTAPMWGPGLEQPFDSDCRPRSRTSPDIPPLAFTDEGYLGLTSSNTTEPFGISPVCEPTIRRSSDGRDWADLGAPFAEGAFVYDLAWRDGRFIAIGGFEIGEPAAWTSTSGSEWEPLSPAGSWGEVDLMSLDAGPAGWVVMGRASDASEWVGWTSREGVCWEGVPRDVDGGDVMVGSDRVLVVDRAHFPSLWLGRNVPAQGPCG